MTRDEFVESMRESYCRLYDVRHASRHGSVIQAREHNSEVFREMAGVAFKYATGHDIADRFS